MRKRRIDARTRVIARECLSGLRSVTATCELLSPRLHWDEELVSEDDRRYIDEVAGAASLLPVGDRRNDWHPNFVGPKLEALAELEEDAAPEVRAICGRLLQVMELRRMEKKAT